MERFAMNRLIAWKEKGSRKPLIIHGARQVGKTWLMKEFGKKYYAQTAYVNFESSKLLQSLFDENYNIARIITAIEIESGVKIDPTNTLIIFDEIQAAPGAITSLKYFCEEAPQYHIISAGSLLGVALHAHTSFPVGKVEFLNLYPLSFGEFLLAMNQRSLFDLLRSKDWSLIKSFKEKYIVLLREYYYVGGMPEAVSSFSQYKDFKEVRVIQKQILTSYEQDFSKHAPNEVIPRIRMLWHSIPAQLAKENKKFIYGAIRQGARAKEYEDALSWLIDCGLVYKVNRVTKPGLPLISYEELNAFKLFILDVGLLGAMGDLDVKTLLEGTRIFEEFKGALTEQYVLEQFKLQDDIKVAYWSSDTTNNEIDFLIQLANEVIPVEVKAEENLMAKSLRAYCQKYNPAIAIRTSMSDYRKEDWLVNIPLYAMDELSDIEE
ncbi:MAG: ATP-binding protein [Bacteroidales bacterium]